MRRLIEPPAAGPTPAQDEDARTRPEQTEVPPPVPRVVRTYDERGRIRSEWWPETDAYLRVSYVWDGR